MVLMYNTNKTLQEQLRFAAEREILQAIDDAKQGQLSPYWQAYHLRELTATKDTPYYPDHGDALAVQLRDAIASHSQISDAQQAKQDFAAIGSELIFFCSAEHTSSIEISYCPKTGLFTGEVCLDWDLTQEQQLHQIEEMKAALTDWIDASCTDFDFSHAEKTAPIADANTFTTLTDVLGYLYFQLNHPHSLLLDRS